MFKLTKEQKQLHVLKLFMPIIIGVLFIN